MSGQYNYCVNCGIAWRSSRMHPLENEDILLLIQQWVAPQVVDSSHHICQACWDLAITAMGTNDRPSTPRVGHRQVCINCGRSVLRKQFHVLRTDNERANMIRTVIREWVLPRNFPHGRALICHRCWLGADRHARHFIGSPSGSSSSQNEMQGYSVLFSQTPRESSSQQVDESSSGIVLTTREQQTQTASRQFESIVLPDYIRAAESESHCFVVGCRRPERNRVPDSTRKMLLNTLKFYVPKNNRLCNLHKNTESWDFLSEALQNYVNVFTAMHIQDMLQLKCLSRATPIFSYVLNKDDRIHHWISLTKDQFRRILDEVPQNDK